jgi:hypothetical protein
MVSPFPLGIGQLFVHCTFQNQGKCNQFLRELVICHAPIRQGVSLDIENMVILQ